MAVQTILDPNGNVVARICHDPDRSGLPYWIEVATGFTVRTGNGERR